MDKIFEIPMMEGVLVISIKSILYTIQVLSCMFENKISHVPRYIGLKSS